MQFDPNNKVVQLCARGMNLEAQGKKEEAGKLFQEAWDISENNFEAFTAAHYIARSKEDPLENLKWNQEALNKANKLDNNEIKAHYPSLYLNIAKSYEIIGSIKEAVLNYRIAASKSNDLPDGPYGEMIKSGISEGLRRNSEIQENLKLTHLIGLWCERKELKPLSLILPAYMANLGSETDLNKLRSALSFLSATRCLNIEEQKILEELIIDL